MGRSWDSAVNVLTVLWIAHLSFEYQIFPHSSNYRGLLWGPPSLLFSGYWHSFLAVSSRGTMLTVCLHVVYLLRMNCVVSLLPLHAFIAGQGQCLPLYCYFSRVWEGSTGFKMCLGFTMWTISLLYCVVGLWDLLHATWKSCLMNKWHKGALNCCRSLLEEVLM